jgi:glycosyltransferase involved in cell wall biosynthesis
LIFVNRSVQELLGFNTKVTVPVTIIHTGVDTEKFRIPKSKKYGKRICSIGYINYKKNPALLLYCFKAIHDYDNAYSFHIAGEHQDPRIQIYFEHLIPRLNIPVTFDGWVKDIPSYLEDKDYVISTSLFESFHYSIAEGMASGVIPLIHDWMGAEDLYPREFIFTTPDSCLQLVKSIEKSDRVVLGQECRQHIIAHYDQEIQLGKIMDVMNKVLCQEKRG